MGEKSDSWIQGEGAKSRAVDCFQSVVEERQGCSALFRCKTGKDFVAVGAGKVQSDRLDRVFVLGEM